MKKTENIIFSSNLQKYLDRYSMTQDALAEKLGVNRSMISNYLHGSKMPRMPKIDAMCRIFHCRRSDLLDEAAGSVSPDEAELLEAFRLLDPEDRQVVLNMTALLAEKSKKAEGVG